MSTTNEIFPKIDKLIDNWCERRALKPLRFILKNYPLSEGLTDDYGALLESLKDVKGLCGNDLSSEEKKVLIELVNAVEDTMCRRTG
jgi:hypothetical protein